MGFCTQRDHTKIKTYKEVCICLKTIGILSINAYRHQINLMDCRTVHNQIFGFFYAAEDNIDCVFKSVPGMIFWGKVVCPDIWYGQNCKEKSGVITVRVPYRCYRVTGQWDAKQGGTSLFLMYVSNHSLLICYV